MPKMARNWNALMKRPVLFFSHADPLLLEDCMTGILVLGSTGTGKTAMVLPNIVKPLAWMGAGFLLSTVKVGDAAKYRQLF